MVWRYWSCPRSEEEAARDFLEKRNPSEFKRAVFAQPESWYDFYVLDFKRRIAYTYGLARIAPNSEKWAGGWNRRLLTPGADPEETAERILWKVCELAKQQGTPPDMSET